MISEQTVGHLADSMAKMLECNTATIKAQMERIAALETTASEAMLHLRNVLYSIADLAPADRTRGMEDALAFYNARRPDEQIVPVESF